MPLLILPFVLGFFAISFSEDAREAAWSVAVWSLIFFVAGAVLVVVLMRGGFFKELAALLKVTFDGVGDIAAKAIPFL